MPLGAVSSEGSSGESISHFAAIRIRTYGAGQLSKKLVPFTMAKQARIIPTRLVNFKSQRASFQLKTSGPNEYFRIHRIVIFSKVSDTSYPGS